MTRIRKVAMAGMAATLAAAIGANICQLMQISKLRGQEQRLQEQQGSLARQIQALRQERDDATNRLAVLLAENKHLHKSVSELPKLRGENARLLSDSKELADLKNAVMKDPIESAAKSWLARVNLLKQRLDQMPEAKNPELQFVTERDWLNAAREGLETDDDYRRAFSSLRHAGESKFVPMLQLALSMYVKANAGQFPTDLSQLQPYFEPAVDNSILQRYQIVPAESFPEMHLGGDRIIIQKAPVDEDLDGCWAIGLNGFGTSGPGVWKKIPASPASAQP